MNYFWQMFRKITIVFSFSFEQFHGTNTYTIKGKANSLSVRLIVEKEA